MSVASPLNDELICHIKKLRVFAYALTKDVQNSHDLLQETICRALEAKPLNRWGKNYLSWLRTIMKNIFLNECRRSEVRRRWAFRVMGIGADRKEPSVANEGEETLYANDVVEQLEGLPEPYRRTLALWQQGFSYEEIAELLRVPIGTVKSRLYAARKRIGGRMPDMGRGQTNPKSEDSLPSCTMQTSLASSVSQGDQEKHRHPVLLRNP